MSRAVSSVAGVVALLGLTVLLSVTLLGTTALELTELGPTASLAVSVEAGTDRIELTHHGGDELDVTDMALHITVDGEPLQYQPPVPFFAAHGFESGPEGAFNSASSNTLRAGQQTSFAVAGTNGPEIQPGAAVNVRITVHETTIYDEKTTAT